MPPSRFNHTVNINDSFSIIYRIPNYRSRMTRFRLVSTAEAVSIRLHNPELCSQKMFIQCPPPPLAYGQIISLNKLTNKLHCVITFISLVPSNMCMSVFLLTFCVYVFHCGSHIYICVVFSLMTKHRKQVLFAISLFSRLG